MREVKHYPIEASSAGLNLLPTSTDRVARFVKFRSVDAVQHGVAGRSEGMDVFGRLGVFGIEVREAIEGGGGYGGAEVMREESVGEGEIT